MPSYTSITSSSLVGISTNYLSNINANINTINQLEESMNKQVDFLNLILSALGVDITFEKFNNMTELEKSQFLRDIRLKKILNDF